jgi:hypothetical protein
VAGLEGDAAGADGVGQPDQGVDRRAEHGTAGPGADDLAVAVEGAADEAQVDGLQPVGVEPSTTAPELALSAMVSTQADLPVAMRLSTISSAGRTIVDRAIAS